ncbi:MAG: hypothetical protein WD401_05315 [Thermomicrobiaceae bacterium]
MSRDPTHDDAGFLAGKREVDLYVRTYNTLLRSSGPIKVETLVPAHVNIQSSLHAGASEPVPDMNAFMYSTMRLPTSIIHTRHIALGQSPYVFARHGYTDLDSWTPVTAPGRRRRWYDNGRGVLAAYVASTSDLDDLVPTIVAWQIEWNKMHQIFQDSPDLVQMIADSDITEAEEEPLCTALGMSARDWERLKAAWGEQFTANIRAIATEKKRMTIQMHGGTYVGYTRSTRTWWRPIERFMRDNDLADRPLYFVSSNTHSIVNTLSGTARRRRDHLIEYVEKTQDPELIEELHKLRSGDTRSSWDNFLYYSARQYFHNHPGERQVRNLEEEARGITSINPGSVLDADVQIIELNKLKPEDFDPRLQALGNISAEHSDAVILNINYPLGMSAYHILNQIAINTHQLKGLYVLGKAATLNARIGDVMLSDVVYDEHSGNTYWFQNVFASEHFSPFLVYGSALDHQRAVTVLGTYLQNREYLDFFYRENFTVVEMEAGPYLSATYEDAFLTRFGHGEHVNLVESPFDLGIIHYASDTPYTRAQTLGARGLSYYGMDSTYASTLLILQRIFQQTGILRADEPVN